MVEKGLSNRDELLMLRNMHEEKLAINLEKCEFMKKDLVYLGFVVSKGSLQKDQDKVEAILNWPLPTTTIEVRIFHGLAQFYWKFIRNFRGICAPFLDTIKG